MTSPDHLCKGVFVATDAQYQNTALDQLTDADCVGPLRRVGPRTIIIEDGDPDAAYHVANTPYGCSIQQLADVVACLPPARDESIAEDIIAAITATKVLATVDGELAVHLWADGNETRTASIWQRVGSYLRDDCGLTVTKTGSEYTMSICIGLRATAISFTKSKHLISNWPGGIVRLAHRGRVSRSAMKLEAALKLTGEKCTGIALDLGASPGGWTQALRDHGCIEVHAVDPLPLHDDVLEDSSVFDYEQTANRFLRNVEETFDVLTCDVKMTAQDAADLVVRAAEHLKRNGLTVVTLRTSTRTISREIGKACGTLEEHFDPILCRQTSANRNEITFVGRKR